MADLLDIDRKRLEKLPPRQLAGELMRLPAKRRLELILERPDAEAVVAAMDTNDFFFSVQEMGPDDALPLLALARPDQLNHLFDIEWWRKDAIEPARALTWLDRLSRAGDPKLIEWLFQADFELLVCLFKQWIQVATAPEDVDLAEARDLLPKTTLDDVYFWEAKFPQYEDLLSQVLSFMFEVSYGFYKELMNHIFYAPDVEMEEQVYRFHRGRLEDSSVPDYYDALEIYRAISRNEMHKKPAEPSAEGADEEHSPPSFALAVVPERDLLGEAIRKVRDPRLLDSIRFELASLANKVIVADQVAPDSPEGLRRGVEKMAAYVNLGLDVLSEGSTRRAKELAGTIYFEHLFRLAHENVSKVRARLREIGQRGWLGRESSGIGVLDPEWFEAAELLLEKTPRLIRPAAGGREGQAGTGLREDFFRTRQDLARGNHLVDVIAAAGCLYEAVSADRRELAKDLWPLGQAREAADITLGMMVLTAAAQFLWKERWKAELLPIKLWPEIFPHIKPAAMEKAVMDWLFKNCPIESRSLAEQYLTPVLRDYEEEMRPFSPANLPDPQFVKLLLFTER